MPYAFSKTGVLLGILVMLVVAGSNCLTSLLLLKAAGKTGQDSYEGVALAIAGHKWKASPVQLACMPNHTNSKHVVLKVPGAA